MSCHQPHDLVAYVQGELAPGERASAEAHVGSCPECREEARRMGDLLARVRALPPAEPDAGFTRRVMLAARARHLEAFRPKAAGSAEAEGARGFAAMAIALRRALAPLPPWAISLAVHALLLFALTWIFLESPPRPLPDTVVVRMAPQAGGGRRDIIWTPPRSEGGALRADVRPAEEDAQEFTPARPPLDRLSPPVAHPAALTPIPEGPSGIPSMERIEDRRILAFVEGRGDARRRREALARHGGAGTEEAVLAALRWLEARQESDGSWDPARFGGLAEHGVGCSALATLAFLGGGHTPREGPFRGTVEKAVRRLVSLQQANGCVGVPAGNYLYGHGLGALALMEAYCLTDDSRLKPAVVAAVGFTQFAQNAAGGWGYAARDGENDTSVTGWQVMVLELARAKGFLTTATSLRQAMEWLDSVTAADGRVGYRAPGQYPNGAGALTAAGMFAHQLVAPLRDAARLERQSSLLSAAPPRDVTRSGAEAINDFYGWYLTSLALFQHGGESWDRWNAALRPALLAAQERAGDHAGSWGPIDRWSGYGGRLYTTAMGALILETYYRYPRLAR